MRTKAERKREKEKTVVSMMIGLYCRAHHHTEHTLCPQCAALNEYAKNRSDHCPFIENKTFCSNCVVHCYRADMREQIRQVMRYAGPRMILYRPFTTIQHIIATKSEKIRLKNVAKQIK